MKRAHHPEQKEARRASILEAAAQALKERGFQDLRMTELARDLDLSKGTLYFYFPTKESLFLALLEDHLAGWFLACEEALGALPRPAAVTEVADVLLDPLAQDGLLVELLGVLHGVLEQNLSLEEVVTFKRFMLKGVQRLAPLMEAALPGLPPGSGLLPLLRLHGMVVGYQAMAQRPPAVAAALQEPDLAVLDLPFLPLLKGTFIDLLAGMTRS